MVLKSVELVLQRHVGSSGALKVRGFAGVEIRLPSKFYFWGEELIKLCLWQRIILAKFLVRAKVLSSCSIFVCSFFYPN